MKITTVVLMACLPYQIIHAATTVTTSGSQIFKLRPNISLSGLSGSRTLAEGQVVVPLYGDAQKALYALAEGDVVANGNNWFGGLGLGYRQIVNDRIYGGYAKLDYSHFTTGNNFWIANPGLETLGEIWDVSVSAYIPLQQVKPINSPVPMFAGHTQFSLNEEAGIGADAEVGRVLPWCDAAKIYLGAYYFNTKDAGSIGGVEGRLTYDLNKYVALECKDSYDNVNHNKFLLGVKFTFGGYDHAERARLGIASRLTETIARHNVASSNFVPTKNSRQIIYDNIWFYQPTSENPTSLSQQQGSGTFEHPYLGFIQDNLVADGSVRRLYFAPGKYDLSKMLSNGVLGRLALPNAWSMYGRTVDYTAPAAGQQRAVFNGGIDLYYAIGNQASNTLDSVIINSTSIGKVLFYADNANVGLYTNNANVVTQDIDINVGNNTPGTANIGAFFDVNSVVNMGKTNIITIGDNTVNTGIITVGGDVYFSAWPGPRVVTGTNILHINESNIIAGGAGAINSGIIAIGDAVSNNITSAVTATLNKSRVSAIGDNATNIGIAAMGNANPDTNISVADFATININESNINATGNGLANNIGIIAAAGSNSSHVVLNLNASNIKVGGVNNQGSNIGVGVLSSVANIANSNIAASGSDIVNCGISAESSSVANFTKGMSNIAGLGGKEGYGLYAPQNSQAVLQLDGMPVGYLQQLQGVATFKGSTKDVLWFGLRQHFVQ